MNTARLMLRAWQTSDVDALAAILGDPKSRGSSATAGGGRSGVVTDGRTLIRFGLAREQFGRALRA